jgi:hypothetical protein
LDLDVYPDNGQTLWLTIKKVKWRRASRIICCDSNTIDRSARGKTKDKKLKINIGGLAVKCGHVQRKQPVERHLLKNVCTLGGFFSYFFPSYHVANGGGVATNETCRTFRLVRLKITTTYNSGQKRKLKQNKKEKENVVCELG